MFIRLTLVSIMILICAGSKRAQTSEVQTILTTLDFSAVRVGVANPKAGEKTASSFVTVYDRGFRLNEVAGCTVTLRNEVTTPSRKIIYDVVIPLSKLERTTRLGENRLEAGPVGSDFGLETYPWTLYFDVKDQTRSIVLREQISKRIIARGAHVSFNVREREAVDQIDNAFKKSIALCTTNRQVVDKSKLPSADSPFAKVYLTKSGQVALDGKTVTLDELDQGLLSLAQRHGVVLYSREAPQEIEPHPVFKKVLDIVIKHKLPVRLCQTSDCSDALTADGKLRIEN